MSPEQAAEKEFPYYKGRMYTPHFTDNIVDAQRAAFLSGVSWQKENGWLAYPENKPVDDNEYLVFTKQGKIKLDEYLPGAQEWYIHDVTHFRPLPPAPASIINK